MSDEREPTPIKRREALKVIATAAALPLTGGLAAAHAEASPAPTATPADEAAQAPTPGPRGTPSDPDLLNPRANWPRKLTAAELLTLSALCDMIIPADAVSPAASAVGVPAYINEYVSAPYEGQQRELVRVRGGLAWLNTESRRRFGRTFARLTQAQRSQVCDDICWLPQARPEHQAAARFFDRVRDLTAEGFYTTDDGMKDLRYIGNVALPRWGPLPPEVRRHLGLD